MLMSTFWGSIPAVDTHILQEYHLGLFEAWLQAFMFDLSTILEVAAWDGFQGKQQEIRTLFLHYSAPPFLECLYNQEDSGKVPQHHTIAKPKALWEWSWMQPKVFHSSSKWIFSILATVRVISIFLFKRRNAKIGLKQGIEGFAMGNFWRASSQLISGGAHVIWLK